MSLLPTVYYFFVIAISAWSIARAWSLNRQYRVDFLRTYAFFVMAFAGYGFLNFTGQVFLTQVIPESSFDRRLGNLAVFTLAIPLGVLWLYFYLGFLARLCLIRIPRSFTIIYWAFNAILILINFRALAILLASRDAGSAPAIPLWNVPVYLGVFLGANFAALFMSRRFPNPFGRMFIKVMAALYLTGFAGLVLFGDVLHLPFYTDRFLFLVFLSVVYFFINVPPLIYLSRSLKGHLNDLSCAEQTAAEPLAEFAVEFKLTKREVEIMGHVVNGLKNEEIGDTLHISLQTVKNTVSSIYRKTGVKNRVQLGNILRNYEDSGP